MAKTAAQDLFQSEPVESAPLDLRKQTEQLPRIDTDPALRAKILPLCRLKRGEVWVDPIHHHRVGVFDAQQEGEVGSLLDGQQVELALNDPPYNVKLGNKSTDALFELSEVEFNSFSERWIGNCVGTLADEASFYIWLGANYKKGFHPIPEVIAFLRRFDELVARNWITVRNQRGYGTQKNWMWIRQELLYYTKGSAFFDVNAEYTDIPKILRGYYKEVDGALTENTQRSKSPNIRAGNVWVDIQQVFYRLEENVPGCYAQKPLKSIQRIISASSKKDSVVLDLFAHSGTTLLAGEMLNRKVITCDIDPIYAEITIRRLERYRTTGKTGWQWQTPFPELL